MTREREKRAACAARGRAVASEGRTSHNHGRMQVLGQEGLRQVQHLAGWEVRSEEAWGARGSGRGDRAARVGQPAAPGARTQDDDGGGAVANLLVLRACQLDHALKGGRGERGGPRGRGAAASGQCAPSRPGGRRQSRAGWRYRRWSALCLGERRKGGGERGGRAPGAAAATGNERGAHLRRRLAAS